MADFVEINGTPRAGGNRVAQAIKLLTTNAFSTFTGNEDYAKVKQNLGAIFGGESLGFADIKSGFESTLNQDNYRGIASSLTRTGHFDKVKSLYTADRMKIVAQVQGLQGLESFTLQSFEGQTQETKAINIVLNTQNRLQTKAADELYKTIFVRYEDEGVRMSVRAAGVGSYMQGPTAWESMTELTPIFGVLRTGNIFKDEVLRIYPVFPADENSADRAFFVDPSVVTPTNITYPRGDAYGRQAHLTQMLKVPCVVNNLMGLCSAPGQRPWTNTDDLESASIRIARLGLTLKIGNGANFELFVPTGAMTNTSMSPTSKGQSSNDRAIDITIRNHPVSALTDKDGKRDTLKTLFASFYDKGYEPNLKIGMTATFNRQTDMLELRQGMVTIDSITRLSDKEQITFNRGNQEEIGLLRSLSGLVTSALPEMNLTNASNANFGYRLEVYDAIKDLTTNRMEPVSVKYPVRPEDVNKEALNEATGHMGISIQLKCSRMAFESAFAHFDYITSIDGAPVVDNKSGGEALPGRMFCNASAVHRSMKIKDHISSPNNSDIFNNITALILGELSDITAALEFKSGIAAINEYSGVDKTKWSLIVHKNLARFLMRVGDARIAQLTDFEIIETNFDSMIGKVLVIPTNDSTESRINPLGGVGVNIAKENIVLHGNVTRDGQDFGVMMTMPCYRHWDINIVMGMLTIDDAGEFLDNRGMLRYLGGIAIRTQPTQHASVTVDNTAAEPVQVATKPAGE